MICIHHDRDLDGFCSGAVVRKKFPDCKLIGWDYGREFPDFEQFKGEDVVMIDVTFPIQKVDELRQICKHLTIIDHHISFFKEYNEFFKIGANPETCEELDDIRRDLRYAYKKNKAACEIAWGFYFTDVMPTAVELLGEYDTWRHNDVHVWNTEIMPFQYYMRLECNSAETFPKYLLDSEIEDPSITGWIYEMIERGKLILKYQKSQNERACKSAFAVEWQGLKGIALNMGGASSTVFDSIWDEKKYDIMIPFFYTGRKWIFSIYTTKKDLDCSVIAKSLGGGGHKQAAGFEMDELPNEFKKQKV